MSDKYSNYWGIEFVGENVIGAPKIRNNFWCTSKYLFLQYSNANIGLFSIAPSLNNCSSNFAIAKVVTLYLIASFLVSVNVLSLLESKWKIEAKKIEIGRFTRTIRQKSIISIAILEKNRPWKIIGGQNWLPITFCSDIWCNKTLKARNWPPPLPTHKRISNL